MVTRNNIRHELSSAYHHESNGHAECAVREIKKLLAKTPTYKAFQQALRNYRNCPRYDGLSPAQWYFGRRQRTEAVAFPSAYEHIPDRIVAEHELQRQRTTDKLRTHHQQIITSQTTIICRPASYSTTCAHQTLGPKRRDRRKSRQRTIIPSPDEWQTIPKKSSFSPPITKTTTCKA